MTSAVISSDITVLLVDDDDVAIEGVLRGVRRQGLECNMVTACDGLEALQSCGERTTASGSPAPS